MNELARGAGRRGGEIVFLAKIDRPAPSGAVSGDSAAVHTAAVDGDVENGPRRRRGLHSPSPKPRRAKPSLACSERAFLRLKEAITSALCRASEKTNDQTNVRKRLPNRLRRPVPVGRRPL